MPWVFVTLAITFEVAATSLIGRTDGFSRPLPTALVLGGYAVAFTMLAQAVKTLEVGLVYAIWSGLGTAAIAAIGIAFAGESVSLGKIAGIVLIIAGVIVLNLSRLPS